MLRENNIGQLLQRDIGREDTDDLAFTVVKGLTVGGHDFLDDNTVSIVFGIGLNPVFLVQMTGYQIPVHTKVLVAIVTLLFGQNTISPIIGIGREVLTLLAKVIGFERDTTALHNRIVLQNLTAIGKHLIGVVQMVFDERDITIGCRLYLVNHHKGIADHSF